MNELTGLRAVAGNFVHFCNDDSKHFYSQGTSSSGHAKAYLVLGRKVMSARGHEPMYKNKV